MDAPRPLVVEVHPIKSPRGKPRSIILLGFIIRIEIGIDEMNA